MVAASATALAPSYREALETSSPVSSLMSVWYSNRTWSTPWLISGW
jgi:hypothetical protein